MLAIGWQGFGVESLGSLWAEGRHSSDLGHFVSSPERPVSAKKGRAVGLGRNQRRQQPPNQPMRQAHRAAFAQRAAPLPSSYLRSCYNQPTRASARHWGDAVELPQKCKNSLSARSFWSGATGGRLASHSTDPMRPTTSGRPSRPFIRCSVRCVGAVSLSFERIGSR